MEVFTRIFGESSKTKLIEYLVYEEPTSFMKADILKKNISWHTCKRIFLDLLELGLIVQIIKVGNIEVYSVNEDNEIFKCLVKVKEDLEKIIGGGKT
ncbi:MAG: hypothetical protein QXP57_08500 [Nitrososphaerota archaeon]